MILNDDLPFRDTKHNFQNIYILKKTLENILSIIVRIGSNRRESENDWGGWKKENGE